MGEKPYNPHDAQSILRFAQQLLNKSLREYLEPTSTDGFKGKGRLGQYLEKHFFGYEPNSTARPDFEEAGIELKTSPLKQTSKGLRAKERLVLNIINYMTEHEHSFETSSFSKKNSRLLLMFYIYQKELSELDYVFRIVRLWEFPDVDLEIIRRDWETIVSKIRSGQAHEISEGDTMYLAASTKGATSSSVRQQPFSPQMAMQRAYSLKPAYLNYIIELSLKGEDTGAGALVTDKKVLKEKSFDELVEERFARFFGKTEEEILHAVGAKPSKSKHSSYILCKHILGVKGNRIEEFEKANVLLKTVVLDANGNLKEAMSFKQIDFDELSEQEWEDSDLYETLTRRFFFVVFQRDVHGRKILRNVQFWGMPFSDLQKAKAVWMHTKSKVTVGDFQHFVKNSDNHVVHVRPKGRNKADRAETKFGLVEKKCFWLNRGYIYQIIRS